MIGRVMSVDRDIIEFIVGGSYRIRLYASGEAVEHVIDNQLVQRVVDVQTKIHEGKCIAIKIELDPESHENE